MGFKRQWQYNKQRKKQNKRNAKETTTIATNMDCKNYASDFICVFSLNTQYISLWFKKK